MTDELISLEAAAREMELCLRKGYPKIADMLWELRDALDAAEAELTAALYAIGETEGDLRAAQADHESRIRAALELPNHAALLAAALALPEIAALVKALRVIGEATSQEWDDQLQCMVEVPMSETEMSAIAIAALAALEARHD